MKLPGTNRMRALEVDFDPMPLAGAVERRKSRGDRADGRKENGWGPSSFKKPAGFFHNLYSQLSPICSLFLAFGQKSG
jgi:hypothetical protein